MSRDECKKKGRTTSIDKSIGRRIRRRRKDQGINQQTLAVLLGISYQQLQKYETGSNRVPASRLPAIAKALGVGVAWFFHDLDRETELPENK